MSDDFHDYGHVEVIGAEAIGKPGNRRFRLFLAGRRGAASLWLEKQQLEELSLALDQLLAQATGGEALRIEATAEPVTAPHAPGDFPDHPDVEFQIASMQIGYDEGRDLMLIRAAPLEVFERDGELFARADTEPQFEAVFTRPQAARLSAHLFAIIASGRPKCPFCGEQMTQPHVCEKQNGYHPVGLN
jgi:uncharacterized repeat protein (TIGR03847 family)